VYISANTAPAAARFAGGDLPRKLGATVSLRASDGQVEWWAYHDPEETPMGVEDPGVPFTRTEGGFLAIASDGGVLVTAPACSYEPCGEQGALETVMLEALVTLRYDA
ncbi:MAG: hypothetical protein ACRDHM_10385, partial [Actinomycetota bacterium]